MHWLSIGGMDIRKVFGLNVRRLRLPTGLSQEAMADETGLGRAHMSSIERGKSNVTLDTLAALSAAFKCGWVDLLDIDAARKFQSSQKSKAPRIGRR